MDFRKEPTVQDLFNLKGRIAFLTGANGHLGASMAESLCEAGAYVILNGRSESRLSKLAAELHEKKYQCEISCGDITNDVYRCNLAKFIEEKFGHLNIIINNAYSAKPTATLETATPDDFRDAYEICVIAVYRMIQLTKKLLIKGAEVCNGTSSVINISTMYGMVSPDPSVYGDSGKNNPPHYGAAKAGLLQLTRYLACHLGQSAIRVNSISPGPFPDITGTNDLIFLNELRKKNPLGKLGVPHELKGAVIFLASEASSFATGINLSVDGGWTAW